MTEPDMQPDMQQPESAEREDAGRPDGIAVAERWISRLFRVGVALCALIIAVGWVSGIALHTRGALPGGAAQDSAVPSPSAQAPAAQGSDIVRQLMTGGEVHGEVLPRTAAQAVRGLADFKPDVVIAAGLVLLIALPILRVALTVAVFSAQRDWVYAAITALVLALLLSSLFLGRAL